MEARRVAVTFTGRPLGALGYSLLLLVLFLLLLPGAWGAAAFMVWWCRHLSLSDNTPATFDGDPRRVWALFAALALLAYLPTLASFGVHQDKYAGAVSGLMNLALIPLEAALKLPIYRWCIESIRLEPGGKPRFTGTYPPYLGWVLLFIVSIFTIIGWAWVATAMLRWFCRHTRGNGYTVEFTGTGLGLLWRSLLWVIGSAFVIPIPWVLRSSYAWVTDNLVLVRGEVQAEYVAPEGWH